MAWFKLGSGYTPHLILAALTVTFGGPFLYGYNVGVLSNMKTNVRVFYGNRSVTDRTWEIEWSLTNVIFAPGGIIGALLSGFLVDIIGRKYILLGSHVFAVAGILLQTLAADSIMFMIGRMLSGVQSGMAGTVVPLFLAEITVPEVRVFISCLGPLFSGIGVFIANLLGIPPIFGRSPQWKLIFLIMLLPVIVSCVALPLLPDTPRFLLLKKNNKDACEKSLRFYRQTEDVHEELEKLSSDASENTNKFHFLHLFGAALRRATLVACLLQLAQQLSGIKAIMFYSTGIFTAAGVQTIHVPYMIVVVSAVLAITNAIAIPVMGVVGHRKLLLIPMIIIVLDYVVLVVAIKLNQHYKTFTDLVDLADGMAYLSCICLIIYIAAFAIGLGPIPTVLVTELFKNEERPKALMMTTIVNWTFMVIVAMSFEVAHYEIGAYAFVIFLCLESVLFFLVYFIVPETRYQRSPSPPPPEPRT